MRPFAPQLLRRYKLPSSPLHFLLRRMRRLLFRFRCFRLQVCSLRHNRTSQAVFRLSDCPYICSLRYRLNNTYTRFYLYSNFLPCLRCRNSAFALLPTRLLCFRRRRSRILPQILSLLFSCRGLRTPFLLSVCRDRRTRSYFQIKPYLFLLRILPL